MATALSLVASLLVDVLIVKVATSHLSSTRGDVHLRPVDYVPLTIVGVVGACAAWPVVARISSTPRPHFFRLAVAVTLLLWLPDLSLLIRHQPAGVVFVLMAMHLGIALVTYNALVHLAPVTDPPDGATVGGESRAPDGDIGPVHVGSPSESGDEGADTPDPVPDPVPDPERWLRRRALVLGLLVVMELVLGIVVLVLVPTGRPSGWLPEEGRVVYVLHALVGVPLTIGAVALVLQVKGTSRIAALCGWIGLVGVVLAGIGGIATVTHPIRIVGLGLMLVGTVVAGFGYVLPALDSLSEP